MKGRRSIGENVNVASVRIDRWLVAVRVYKTRTDAAAACTGGKVRVDGRTVKPSFSVGPGARVEARLAADRVRELEVVNPIEKRVGATIAAECSVDHSPPAPPRAERPAAAPFEREAGAGRPTKRDRRRLDRLRGR